MHAAIVVQLLIGGVGGSQKKEVKKTKAINTPRIHFSLSLSLSLSPFPK